MNHDTNTEGGKKNWCGCCDNHDKGCRCMCHRVSWRRIAIALLLVAILGLVFALGVKVGKCRERYRSENNRMKFQYREIPLRRHHMQMPFDRDGSELEPTSSV